VVVPLVALGLPPHRADFDCRECSLLRGGRGPLVGELELDARTDANFADDAQGAAMKFHEAF
jgi:hypothetical protein